MVVKEWINGLLSADQSWDSRIIGYLIVGAAVFLAIGISWFLLFLIATSIIKSLQWVLTKTKNPNSIILEKFRHIEYFIEENYSKFNIFKIGTNIKERLSEKGILKYNLAKGMLWGTIAVIIAFWVVFSLSGNPFYEFRLLTIGTTTKGFITDVTEEIEPRDAGGNTYYYNYTYNFKLSNGKTIHSHQVVSGGSQQETPDVSIPYPTEIVYLKSNPEINKLKETLSDGIWEILWRKIGLGSLLLLGFSLPGYILIRNAIKEYRRETKKLTSNKN